MCPQIDPSVTWEFVAWLRSVTKLPIVVKVNVHSHTGLRVVVVMLTLLQSPGRYKAVLR